MMIMKKITGFICFITCSQIFCSNPLALEEFTDTITLPHQQYVEQFDLDVEEDILDNSLCKNGVVWREFNEGEGPLKGTAVHYTVTPTYEATKKAYYSAGVSANYTVDENGIIHVNVKPISKKAKEYSQAKTEQEEKLLNFLFERLPQEKLQALSEKNIEPGNITFHAGISGYDGDINLNSRYISIEIVLPGYVEKGVEYKGIWSNPELLRSFLGIQWFKYQKKQYETVGTLVRLIQLEFGIYGRLIVGHNSIACGRKVDPGIFPYRLIFEKFEAGYFPSFDKINELAPLLQIMQYEDFLGLLGVYGYNFLLPTHYLQDYEKKMEIYRTEKEAYEKDKGGKVKPKEPRKPNVPKQEGYEGFVLGAFRLHFCSDLDILGRLSSFGTVSSELNSKELSDLEKIVILSLSVGYYNYEDKDLGYDEIYRSKLNVFVHDNERKARMEEFISLIS